VGGQTDFEAPAVPDGVCDQQRVPSNLLLGTLYTLWT
jgi:hypothetical protein